MNTQEKVEETDDIFKAKTRQALKNILQENILVVTFKKADGSERVMKCTLSPSVLPVIEESNKPKKKRTPNPDVLSVFDVEANGWRSFKYEALIDFKFSLEENFKHGLI